MVIKGTTLEGDDITKTVALQLGEAGADGRKRLADAGLQLVPLGANVQVGAVKFGSRAKRGGFESGWDVAALKVPTGAPSPHWFYLPALLLVGVVEPGAAHAIHTLSARLHCAASGESSCPCGLGPPKAQGLDASNAQAKGLASVPATGRSSLERGWRQASPPKGQARHSMQRQSLR
jgi:Domain of unknown function (DUF3394)